MLTTTTGTVPVPAGAVTTIDVSDAFWMVAGVCPNRTYIADASPVPVMVTVLPPAAGPVAGDTFVTTGAPR
jgi:hypothetical protein